MSEHAHLPTDAHARERAVNSLHSVLVQAPAGSGKTTLLAQRYLRLLGAVDSPERILALTFTRRAAQEMRHRVLTAFEAASSDKCPADFNLLTWTLARGAKQRMDALGCDVQSQPARLRIETIDAFNAWLANQLPVSAGAGSGLRVLPDARPCYEEAARRALSHDANDQFAAAVDRVLELDDQRWRKLVALIAEMLPSRDRWLPLLAGRLRAASALDEQQLERVRKQFDEDLALLVGRVLLRAQELMGGEILTELSALIHGAAGRLDATPELAAWHLDGASLRAEPGEVGRWRAMAQLMTTERGLRKIVTKAQGFPPGSRDKERMLALLEQLDRDPRIVDMLLELRTLPDSSYSDAAWGRVREVAQVLVLASAELDGVFREQGAVDFPAVSLGALRALGTVDAPTDLSLRLDYRLQHILVDEFQDTSSSQLELVRLLTNGWQRDDGRSVFCVGDPMQSIYGFRQAEVRAFLELAEEGIGSLRFDVQRLRSNFRSAPPLVEWTNRCFTRLMPQFDDRARGAIAFRPSDAAVKSAATECDVRCIGFSSRAAESVAIADLIGIELERNPSWRIAVLVRARAHAREIAASLRDRNIAFRAVDIEPLNDRAAVRDVIMLCCALLHLGDRTAWLAVLRAPWAGLTLSDLLSISRRPALIWESIQDSEVLSSLSEQGRERCAHLGEVLQAAFRVRSETSLARWVERTWLGLGGPACVGATQDLELAEAAFARLRQLEERGMPDAADLADSFADLFANHGTRGAVEIMTIHKAKGLEFDMVVLPALDRAVPPDRSQLLLSHQFARTGRDGMVMAARPPVGTESDLLFDFLRCQRRDAATLEAQRLLYVACTRAKCRLRLTAMIGEGESHDEPEDPPRRAWRPRAGSLLRVLWPVAADEFELAAANPAGGDPRTEGAPRGGPLRRVPQHWSPPPPGGALQETAVSLPARQETPIFDWAGETARRVGSLVHAELQALRLENLDENSIRARQAQFMRWLELHGVPSDRLDEATRRVVDALLGVYRDPRGRWILQAGYRDDLREHAVTGYLEGQLIRAVFDRSFIDEAGRRWVIDYKTSQHLGGDLEIFLDREVERYRPQLERYGRLARRLGPEPVRLGLYFPLMGAWREWSYADK